MSRTKGRGRRTEKAKKPKRMKAGKAFELAVAEVVRAFGPNSSVEQGTWVVGPDGRRDRDVHITERVDGREKKILIECKDYNPKTTGPIGIVIVDAFDSKLRDLTISTGAIVSNAGFTGPALAKAHRLGIGVLGVMLQGDSRIRFRMRDRVYFRRVTVTDWRLEVPGPAPGLAGAPLENILYDGRPMIDWLVHRTQLFIGSNPIVRGTWNHSFHFRTDIDLECPSGIVRTSQLTLLTTISGAWFEHEVELDSSKGLYDWSRHRFKMPSGKGSFQIGGIDFEKGVLVASPPMRYLRPDGNRGDEFEMMFVKFQRFPINSRQIPELEALLPPEDLDVFVKDLPLEMCESDPHFDEFSGLPLPGEQTKKSAAAQEES